MTDPGQVAWPAPLRGVTETVTTTRGPEGRWNVAALGVRAPADGGDPATEGPASGASGASAPGGPGSDAPATARTWGRTRTRGNFERRGEGYVQFVDDPLVFVQAALGVAERDEPVLPDAAAWARVTARRRAEGVTDGTEWVEWTLRPVEAVVRERRVPTINRGFGAVVEATVWASRLGVEGYDEADLRERLDFLADVVDAAGGERERAAFERLRELSNA